MRGIGGRKGKDPSKGYFGPQPLEHAEMGPLPGADVEEPVIEAFNLSKSYGSVLGVSNINLRLEAGVTGLLGPNGAGKSTFLKLLLGIIHPNLGHVKIHGVDVKNHVEVFERIGYVPEHDCFVANYTGVDYVAYHLRLHGVTKAKAQSRAEVLLKRMELDEEALHRRIWTYSKGMKQKVKLARALGHDPDLLLLDEPFQGADPTTRRLMINNIESWADQGKSVLISSHILQDISAMTDTIALINGGRLLAYGHRRTIRQMIENVPQRVLIKPMNRSALKGLGHDLLSLPSVKRLEFVGTKEAPHHYQHIEVQTHFAKHFYRELPALMNEKGHDIDRIESPDDNLDTLYSYLVGGEQWNR